MSLTRQARPSTPCNYRPSAIERIDPRTSGPAFALEAFLAGGAAVAIVLAPALLLWAAGVVALTLALLTVVAAGRRYPALLARAALLTGVLTLAAGIGWVAFAYGRTILMGLALMGIAAAFLAPRGRAVARACRCPR